MSVQPSSAASQATAPLTIAIDAMGGDHGPEEVVKAAAALSIEKRPGERPCTSLPRRDARGYRRSCMSFVMTPSASPSTTPKKRWHGRVAASCARQQARRQHRGSGAPVCRGAWRCPGLGGQHRCVGAGLSARYFRRPGVRRCALAAVYPTEMRRGEKTIRSRCCSTSGRRWT